MLEILVFMAIHLLTMEMLIKFLMLQDNKENLFILLESPLRKRLQYIYMKKKDMALTMEILLSSDK